MCNTGNTHEGKLGDKNVRWKGRNSVENVTITIYHLSSIKVRTCKEQIGNEETIIPVAQAEKEWKRKCEHGGRSEVMFMKD